MRSLSESIPSFPVFNIAGSTYQWIAEPYWQNKALLYFAEQTKNNSSSLLRSPYDCVRNRQELQSIKRHRLLLQTVEDAPQYLGWATTDFRTGRYRTAFTLVSCQELEPASYHAAVKHLISAIFYGFQLDQTKLVCFGVHSDLFATLAEFPAGKLLHFDRAHAWVLDAPNAFEQIPVLDLNKSDWSDLYKKEDYVKIYNYLTIRHERRARQLQLEKTQTKRRRSFLARLFNPKIDDSFF